jgi:hypothetical protein
VKVVWLANQIERRIDYMAISALREIDRWDPFPQDWIDVVRSCRDGNGDFARP